MARGKSQALGVPPLLRIAFKHRRRHTHTHTTGQSGGRHSSIMLVRAGHVLMCHVRSWAALQAGQDEAEAEAEAEAEEEKEEEAEAEKEEEALLPAK